MIYLVRPGLPQPLTVASPPGEAQPVPAAHDDLENWTDLLQALTARLRAGARAGAADASARGAQRLQQLVTDCASDLDLLHQALCAERARQHRLETGAIRTAAGSGESLAAAPGEARSGTAQTPGLTHATVHEAAACADVCAPPCLQKDLHDVRRPLLS